MALNLEDIDWDNGHITVRAKGGRWSQLPLPADVGKAIAFVYLRQRSPSRFLSTCIPFVTVSSNCRVCELHRDFFTGDECSKEPAWNPRERVRIYFVTDWRRTCSVTVPRWTRLATCSVTRAQTQLQSTPRWILSPSALWRSLGREALFR